MTEPTLLSQYAAAELLERMLDDYDRRRKHWWGRFLLWLLRKTT